MPRSLDVIAAIAIGGAVGGVARYFVTDAVSMRAAGVFPAGTFVVNVAGCLVAGFLMRMILDTSGFSPAMRALLTTGFCGGFTTFSTFAWEAFAAADEGALRRAVLYTVATVVCGLIAIWAGGAAAKLLLGTLRARSA
ncbi:MAG: fluoride efflux transporter CrcB [Gemmatimonadales bacterium]